MRWGLSTEPTWLLLLLGSVVAYSLSHALTALAAGLLGRALTQSPDHGLAAHATGLNPWDWPLTAVCNVGLVAVLVKGASAILLAFSERKLALSVGHATRGAAIASVLFRDANGRGDSRAADANLDASGPAERQRFTPGPLGALLTHSIREIENGVQLGLLRVVRASAQLVPLIAALIFVSGPLALAALAALLPFGGVTAVLRRRFRANSELAHDLSVDLHAELDEFVRHTALWRTYGAGARILSAVSRAGARAARADARVVALQAGLSSGNELLGALALVATIVVAQALGWRVQDGRLLTGAAIFFMMYRPLRDLGDGRGYCLRAASALKSLGPLLPPSAPQRTSRPKLPAATKSANLRQGPERIELQRFGARDWGPETTLRCEAGHLLLLQGPTGSGKSTLFAAMLGLVPARGTLRYGGKNLTPEPVGTEHRPFAWVPQDAPLITASILDNVTLLSGDERRGRAALELLELSSWAKELGSTPIGAGGRAVSGGQRRLLSLARSVATGQPVLLLDEPLSGLDTQTTARVVELLGRLKRQHSVIVASHRPELAAIADHVVQLGATTAVAAE